MTLREVNEKIDRLLHDAEHAESGARMARMMGDAGFVVEATRRCQSLIDEAVTLYRANPGAEWPEDSGWRPV